MLDRVIAASHVVTQQATSQRTGVPVIGGIKNSFRISLFLSKNHRDIVVEAQRGNVEEHFQFRYWKYSCLTELLFWEWPADNRVGNQHVKFFLARHAVDGLVVHRTSSQSYKDVNNLFLFAMRAVNGNF
jgi:hypothetical protein